MYAETLRLEMQPLGCHVTYVMTGGVATPMFYDQAITFADDSPYQPIADKITAGWKQKPGYVLLPAVEYARHVVEKMTQRIPPQEVWCGTGINGLWWFEELRLTWLLDIVYSRHHGLNTSLV
jgi:1-acylglycerone phosphate reductase